MRAGADVLLEKPPAPSMAEFRRLERVSAETGMRCSDRLPEPGLGGRARAAGGGRGRGARRDPLDRGPLLLAAPGRLLHPLAVGRAPRAERDRGDGRGADQPAGPRRGHRAGGGRVRSRGRRARGRAGPVPGQRHPHRRHLDGAGAHPPRHVTCCWPPRCARRSRPSRRSWCTAARPPRCCPTPRTGSGSSPRRARTRCRRSWPALAGEHGRTDLLANLLAHRADPGVPLLAELGRTGAFTAVLEALRTAPPPAAIPPSCARWADGERGRHAGGGRRRAVGPAGRRARPDVHRAGRAVDRPRRRRSGRAAAPRRHRGRARTTPAWTCAPTSSPRPFLHPVRTLGGLTVTDAHPADHDWHLGIGVAVQDVAGWNLWGGRTYVRGAGYTWRPDHGRIEHVGWRDRGPGRLAQDLRWVDGRRPVAAARAAGAALVPAGRVGARGLAARPRVHPRAAPADEPVRLGSPGSNGREGGGYGGFFWRLPPVDELDVCTPDAARRGGGARQRRAVAGRAAADRRGPGDAAGAARSTRSARPTRGSSGSAGYPGLGAALAWDEPVTVEPERPLHRGYRLVIADGDAAPEALVALTARPV